MYMNNWHDDGRPHAVAYGLTGLSSDLAGAMTISRARDARFARTTHGARFSMISLQPRARITGET